MSEQGGEKLRGEAGLEDSRQKDSIKDSARGDSINDSTQGAQKADSKPRLEPIVRGANELSVGISIVVAVLLGIGVGWGLQWLSGVGWLFWLGVAWGIGAAILNLYKAYKRQLREAEELAQNPRYAYGADSAKSKRALSDSAESRQERNA